MTLPRGAAKVPVAAVTRVHRVPVAALLGTSGGAKGNRRGFVALKLEPGGTLPDC